MANPSERDVSSLNERLRQKRAAEAAAAWLLTPTGRIITIWQEERGLDVDPKLVGDLLGYDRTKRTWEQLKDLIEIVDWMLHRPEQQDDGLPGVLVLLADHGRGLHEKVGFCVFGAADLGLKRVLGAKHPIFAEAGNDFGASTILRRALGDADLDRLEALSVGLGDQQACVSRVLDSFAEDREWRRLDAPLAPVALDLRPVVQEMLDLVRNHAAELPRALDGLSDNETVVDGAIRRIAELKPDRALDDVLNALTYQSVAAQRVVELLTTARKLGFGFDGLLDDRQPALKRLAFARTLPAGWLTRAQTDLVRHEKGRPVIDGKRTTRGAIQSFAEVQRTGKEEREVTETVTENIYGHSGFDRPDAIADADIEPLAINVGEAFSLLIEGAADGVSTRQGGKPNYFLCFIQRVVMIAKVNGALDVALYPSPFETFFREHLKTTTIFQDQDPPDYSTDLDRVLAIDTVIGSADDPSPELFDAFEQWDQLGRKEGRVQSDADRARDLAGVIKRRRYVFIQSLLERESNRRLGAGNPMSKREIDQLKRFWGEILGPKPRSRLTDTELALLKLVTHHIRRLES